MVSVKNMQIALPEDIDILNKKITDLSLRGTEFNKDIKELSQKYGYELREWKNRTDLPDFKATRAEWDRN